MPPDSDKLHALDIAITRLETQVGSNDVRYQERYEGQQLAMQTALIAQKFTVEAALAAQKEAVIKAEIANEKRFDSVNGFRALVSDQQATLMPRTEAELRIGTLTERVDALTTAMASQAGKQSGLQSGWMYLIGAVSIIVGLSGIILHFIK